MKKIILISAIFLGSQLAVLSAQMYKLDNGQTVVIHEVKNNPIVTIDTWIKTGSIDETDENNGVAHFLEHLFFKGTKKHASGEFDRILETKGAINNAATSKDFTHYYITIPSKDFDLALELHADMLQNPMIPRKEMEKERKVVLEEISKDLNSPQKILYDNLNSMLFTSHPYKRRVIGKSEVIETITRDQILNFYNEHYQPSNMVTVVVGDVDTNHILEKIKENFKSTPQKTNKTIYKKDSQITSQKKSVEYLDETETGYMIIGFKGTAITDKDSYALDVLSTILGEGRSSILNQVLKENKRIVDTISAGNSTMRDDGIFYISSTFEPTNIKTIQSLIFEEIQKVQEKGVTDEQLKLAKNIIERETYYSRESVSNIATEIGYTTVLTNDLKFYDTYIEKIKNVSNDDIKRVANKYLGVNKSAISIILPTTAKNEVSIAQKKHKNGSAKLVSQNNQSKKYKLSNGSTLIYTPNSSNDIIAMTINSKGGQLIEKKRGIATLTSSTMMRGTKRYSSLDLAQILDDNGIKINPTVNSDVFSLSVMTTKEEYDKTLDLLNEIVNQATFDNVEIDKMKKEKLAAIKKNKDIPLQRAVEQYKQVIYGKSPYSNSSKYLEESIPTITREDIVEYYNGLFKPNDLVISINGNIDETKTIKELNNIFQKQNSQQDFNYKNYSKNIPTLTSPQQIKNSMPSTQTAWILLGWQTDGILNEKDYATLQIIDTLLGSGMSSRLFVDLREQQGLAYQLGSSFSPNFLKGNFLLYIGTNPQNVDFAKKGLFNEINKLKTQYVGDKELKDAKDKLIGNYIIGQETNFEKASTLGFYETSSKGYEFKERYEKLINAVTDSDIIEVANKYFGDNYVLSIITN